MTSTDAEAPPTVEQTTAALAAAVAEDEQATGALTTVERAIAAGDTSISAEDLAEARSLARFARLRLEAAMNRHERARPLPHMPQPWESSQPPATPISGLTAKTSALTSSQVCSQRSRKQSRRPPR